VDDLLHGQSLEYHPNGKLRSTASFQKGIKEGISQGFFSDGRMAWQEEYHQGLLCDGLYFNTNGDQIAAVESKKGMQARFNGDAICRIVEIKRGIQEGKVNRFNDQGELIGTYFIRNGKKQGEEIEYFLNSEIEEDNLYEKSLKNYKIDQEGSQYHNRVSQNSAHSLPKLSVCWDQDAIHGTVKTWYSNGKMQSQREYCRNQKQGTSLAWYKNGSLMLVEEYEQGMLTKGSYYKKNQNEPISTIVNGNGTAYLYDEEGIFLRKITYIKNKPIDPED
jgi:antitoxin component YwqK of YwqJK toxin-antitoxin module